MNILRNGALQKSAAYLALLGQLSMAVFIPAAKASAISTNTYGDYGFSVNLYGDFDSPSGFEGFVNFFPEFERKSSGKVLFDTYSDFETNDVTYDIDAFWEVLFKESKNTLLNTYVPIGMGGVTSIIPIYYNDKKIGDREVQRRIILEQIRAMVQRTLLNDKSVGGFSSYSAQVRYMYDQALDFAKANPQYKYGDALLFERNASPRDMIWPERKKILGQTVVVPVVYLTRGTYNRYQLEGHEFNAGSIDVNSFEAIEVDVNITRDNFIRAADNLSLINSSVSADSKELTLIAGGSLDLLSSQVRNSGNINFFAKEFNAETIVWRYDLGNVSGTRFGSITGIDSDSGDVLVQSVGDINIAGVSIGAEKGGIKLKSDGSIFISGQAVQSAYQGRENGWKVNRNSSDYLMSSLTAEQSISLYAGGVVSIAGSELYSEQGHIEILANLGISIEDAQTYSQEAKSKKYSKREVNESTYQTVAIRSLLDAGKGVVLHTEGGDLKLKAVDIRSQEGAKATAKTGTVELLVTNETNQYSYSSIKKGMWSTVVRNKGYERDNIIYNTVVGGLQVEAQKGVVIEYVGDPNKSLEEQLAAIAHGAGDQKNNMSWLLDVHRSVQNAAVDNKAFHITYNEIVAADTSWNKSSKSLSPAAMALITIAVAAAAGPAASGISSAVSTAAASTVGTSVAAGLGSAAAAGFSSLMTTAAVTMANGASPAETLKYLGSDENLSSLATTVATAGVVAGLNDAFFSSASPKEIAQAAEEARQKGQSAQEVSDLIAKMAGNSTSSLSAQIGQLTAKTAVQASVSTLLNDGSLADFTDTFYQQLGSLAIAELGEYMANEIGKSWDIGGPDAFDTAMKYVLHAGAGCVVGSLTAANENNQDEDDGCQYGALGGVIGEFVGSLYRTHTKEEVEQAQGAIQDLADSQTQLISDLSAEGYTNEQIQQYLRYQIDAGMYLAEIDSLVQNGVNLAGLSSGLAAMLAGANAAGVDVAAMAGENAAENNAFFLVAVPYILAALNLTIVAYDIHQLYLDIEEAGGDDDAARQVLAERLYEWYESGGLLEEIALRILPAGKIAEKSVKAIKDALDDLDVNPSDRLSDAVAAGDQTVADMVGVKVQESRANGDLPDGMVAPNSGSRYNNPSAHKSDLASQSGIPEYIDLTNPNNVYGLDSQQLKTYFELNGYDIKKAPVKSGTSGNAQVYNIINHAELQKVQHSPSTASKVGAERSQHVGEYIKFTYKSGQVDTFGNRKVYVIDPETFQGTASNSTFYNQSGQLLEYVDDRYRVVN